MIGRRRQQARKAARQRHQAYWQRRQSGELVYVALGDSAAVGVGAKRPQDGYVGLLGARLAKHTGRTVATHNLAVNGATAADVLCDQLPRLAEIDQPAMVTCAVGGNDVAWSRRFDAAAFERTMARIATELPSGALLGLVPSFGHRPYETRVRHANYAIRRVGERAGLAVADIYTPTRAYFPWGFHRYLARDFFHPNEAGYTLWADAFWRVAQLPGDWSSDLA